MHYGSATMSARLVEYDSIFQVESEANENPRHSLFFWGGVAKWSNGIMGEF